MSNKIVFSGLGHGGSDPGAAAYGLVEKEMVLVMATACHDVLVAHDVDNPMSRYKDENDTVQEEAREANASGATLAIDWHVNAGGGDGFEAYCSICGGLGRTLAENIESEVKALGQNSRGVKTKTGSDGRDYYHFIRETTMHSVIIEAAFIDNSNDISFVDTIEEQRAYGVAVAKGILKTLGIPYKGEGSTTPTPEPPANNFNCYTVKITADVLNVRKGPGTNYAVGTTVKRGEVYTIVGEQAGWGKLKSGAGWISLEYTTKTGTVSAPVKTIKVGSRVKITGSNYAIGQTIPSWVKSNVYTVQQISGSKALIKEIVSWVYIKDLILV